MRSAWLFALVLGCAPETGTRALEQDTVDLPTLRFHADWTVTQTGTLVAGAPAKIVYDIARLPDCRAIYQGLPAWAIAAYWNADGGWGHSGTVTTGETTFTVPAGHDLELWFHASDELGCSEWDSDFGRNFHFAIVSPPIVHFRYRDFAVEVDGTPRAGGDVMIAAAHSHARRRARARDLVPEHRPHRLPGLGLRLRPQFPRLSAVAPILKR